MFEKLVDIIMFRGRPTMHDLGLEFLRMHDGKFNYQEGHTVSYLFFFNHIRNMVR